MWGGIIFDTATTANYTLGFQTNQNSITLHLTHWQYWFWFWFTFYLGLYYLIFLNFILKRSLKFHPKINNSFRPHGKWGDVLIAVIPLSWCLNILSNSNFILRLVEWQAESSTLTLRVRGKQWYWVYKIDLQGYDSLSRKSLQVGRSSWIENNYNSFENISKLQLLNSYKSGDFISSNTKDILKNNTSSLYEGLATKYPLRYKNIFLKDTNFSQKGDLKNKKNGWTNFESFFRGYDKQLLNKYFNMKPSNLKSTIQKPTTLKSTSPKPTSTIRRHPIISILDNNPLRDCLRKELQVQLLTGLNQAPSIRLQSFFLKELTHHKKPLSVEYFHNPKEIIYTLSKDKTLLTSKKTPISMCEFAKVTPAWLCRDFYGFKLKCYRIPSIGTKDIIIQKNPSTASNKNLAISKPKPTSTNDGLIANPTHPYFSLDKYPLRYRNNFYKGAMGSTGWKEKYPTYNNSAALEEILIAFKKKLYAISKSKPGSTKLTRIEGITEADIKKNNSLQKGIFSNFYSHKKSLKKKNFTINPSTAVKASDVLSSARVWLGKGYTEQELNLFLKPSTSFFGAFTTMKVKNSFYLNTASVSHKWSFDYSQSRYKDNFFKVNPTNNFIKKKVTQNHFFVLKQKRFFYKNPVSNSEVIFNKNFFLKEANNSFTRNALAGIYKSNIFTKRLLRTSKVLVLPTKTNITVITNSFDVVHSWFIPGLGFKLDCIPGRSTHHTLHITNSGFYYGQCAEICGRYHHHMPIRICAMPYVHFIFWWENRVMNSFYQDNKYTK